MRYQTCTHPYGYMLTQNERNFGFIRISKNASTSIAAIKELKLTSWAEIEGFRGNIYAVIRNPIERFVSSIPETLLRINSVDPIHGNRGDDVIVPYYLKKEIYGLKVKKLDDFMRGYVDIVGQDFFDAHHEPQIKFITDMDGRFYSGLSLFSLSKLVKGLKYIAVTEGYNEPVVGMDNSRMKSSAGFKKKIVSLRRFFSGYRQRKLDDDNPLAVFSRQINVSIEQAQYILRRELAGCLQNSYVIESLEEMYSVDLAIFKELDNYDVVSAASLRTNLGA